MFLFIIIHSLCDETIETEGSFTFRVQNGNVFSLIGCTANSTDLIIPRKVRYVEEYAFANCSSLYYSFESGSVLESIARYTFTHSSVIRIVFPESFIKIDNGLFNNCKSIQHIVFNADDLVFNDPSLQNLTNLKTITIGGRVVLQHKIIDLTGISATIGSSVLLGSPIASIILPENFDYPFQFCSNAELKQIEMQVTTPEFSANTFQYSLNIRLIINKGNVLYNDGTLDVSNYEGMTIGAGFSPLNVEVLITNPSNSNSAEDFNLVSPLHTVFVRGDVPNPFILQSGFKDTRIQSLTYNGIQIKTFGEYDLSGLNIISLADTAFARTPFLTRFVLSNVENGIGDAIAVFGNCPNLEKVVIPFPLTKIPESTFTQCSKLKSLVINGNDLFHGSILDLTRTGINNIGKNAFYYCNQIQRILFDGLNYKIDIQAFYISDLISIEFVHLPEGPIIESNVFIFNNPNLNIFLPLVHCDSSASFNWTSLIYGSTSSSIKVNDCLDHDDEEITNSDFEYDKTTLNKYIGEGTSVIIPAGTEVINSYAFKDSAATTVTFEAESSLVRIVLNAFADSEIKQITLPENFGGLSFGLFSNVGYLETITIPYDSKTLPIHCFQGCSKLKSITVGSKEILSDQVLDFSGSNIEAIGEDAFLGVLIKKVVFSSQIHQNTTDAIGLRNNTILDEVIFQFMPRSIDAHMFEGCINLKTVKINGTSLLEKEILDLVTFSSLEVEEYAFVNVSIKELKFNNVSNFVAESLHGVSLTNVSYSGKLENPFSIPLKLRDHNDIQYYSVNEVLIIDNYNVKIPDTVTTVGEVAFAELNSILSATFPVSIQSIGAGVFQDCVKLDNVTITNGSISIIPARAFQYAISLKTVIIGDHKLLSDETLNLTKITSVDAFAFAHVPNIKVLIIGGNQVALNEGSFQETPIETINFVGAPYDSIALTPLHHPFRNCLKIKSITVSTVLPCEDLIAIPFSDLFGGSNVESGDWIQQLVSPTCDNSTVLTFNDTSNTVLKSAQIASNISSWLLPNQIISMLGKAFADSSITNFDTSSDYSRLRTVEPDIFDGSKIVNATFPKSLIILPDNFAESNTKLERVIFTGGLTHIPSNAFKGCSSLREVKIGGTDILTRSSGSSLFLNLLKPIESVGEGAFVGLPIVQISLPPVEDMPSVYEFRFTQYPDLMIIHIPAGKTIFQESKFKNLTKLSTISYGNDDLLLTSTLKLTNSDFDSLVLPPYCFYGVPIDKIEVFANSQLDPTSIVFSRISDLSIKNFAFANDEFKFPSYFSLFPKLYQLSINNQYCLFDGVLDLSPFVYSTSVNKESFDLIIYDKIILPVSSAWLSEGLFQNNSRIKEVNFSLGDAPVNEIPARFFQNSSVNLVYVNEKPLLYHNEIHLNALSLNESSKSSPKKKDAEPDEIVVNELAFADMASIHKINIPSGKVKLLGKSFGGLPNLNTIVFELVSSQFDFQGKPFDECLQLKTVVIPSDSQSNQIDFGSLLSGTPLEGSSIDSFLPTPTPTPDEGASLSTGAIAAIAIASIVVGLAIIAVVIFFICKFRARAIQSLKQSYSSDKFEGDDL